MIEGEALYGAVIELMPLLLLGLQPAFSRLVAEVVAVFTVSFDVDV